MESTLKEYKYNSPRKRNLGVIVANTWQHFPHLLLDCCTQESTENTGPENGGPKKDETLENAAPKNAAPNVTT